MKIRSMLLWGICLLDISALAGKQLVCNDEEALAYCASHNNAYISILYPRKQHNKAAGIRTIFKEFGSIIYEKNIVLFDHGPLNLVRIAYQTQSWIGDYSNNFAHARLSVKRRFRVVNKDGSYTVKVVLFLCTNLERVRQCKKKLRALIGQGSHAIHINDTHEETMTLAQTVFNNNSVMFLNCIDASTYKDIDAYINALKQFLAEHHYDPEHVCVVGDFVKTMFGQGAPQQLMFITHDDIQTTDSRTLCCLNHDVAYQNQALRDAHIFDPTHYFYYNNIKFSMLPNKGR